MTQAEQRELNAKIKAELAEARAKLAEDRKTAQNKAIRTWDAAPDAKADHPYARKKQVKPHGLRCDGDSLLVPLFNEDGKLQSLQFIDRDGEKRFPGGSRVKGCHYWVVTPKAAEDGKTICICEGWATGESIYQATGYAVVIAFNAANLGPVAEWVRKNYPKCRIVICADDDVKTEGNPGVREAAKAAQAVDGLVAKPEFGAGRGDSDKDFNDMMNATGAQEVKRAIDAAVPVEDDIEEDEEGEDGRHNHAKQADVLIDLASAVGLFHNDTIGYADIDVDGHRESWPIRSRGFKDWLLHRYYNATHSAPSGEALRTAIETIGARARFDAPQRDVFMRVGGHGGKIYIDLCNKDWQAVEIDARGWRVTGKPPVRFRRAPGMEPLPIPSKGGSIDDLRPFVNVAGDADFVLLVAWLLAAYRDRGPYPGLGLKGDEGSAKSTLARVLRELIDPSKVKERRLPSQDRDLHIHASNSYVLAFGNVSELPDWLSDSLCSLATGGGFATRVLYTDQDEMLFNAMRPVVLNGIEYATRSDLADRLIFLKLPPIKDDKRRTEQELWNDFEAKRPYIIGALLDIVAHGLRELPNTPMEAYPRMADFAHWIAACEGAVWQPGEFKAAYNSNRSEATLDVLEADPIASAIRMLMKKWAEWEGTATQLLDDLGHVVGEKETKRKSWPGSAAVFGQRLRRVKNRLERSGIEIDFEAHAKERLITITRQDPENAVTPVTPVIADKSQRVRDDSKKSRTVTPAVTPKSLGDSQNDSDDGDDSKKHTLSSRRLTFQYRPNEAARKRVVSKARASVQRAREQDMTPTSLRILADYLTLWE